MHDEAGNLPMLTELLGTLEGTGIATALRGSRNAYPVVNALHILAIGALFGSILALDLRLLGAARSIPLQPLARYLPRVAGSGLALAVATGLLLFAVQPFDYVDNRAFLVKITLVAIGTVHALGVHASGVWKRLVDGRASIDGRLKISAALSLGIWTAAVFCGRFIAF